MADHVKGLIRVVDGNNNDGYPRRDDNKLRRPNDISFMPVKKQERIAATAALTSLAPLSKGNGKEMAALDW